METQHQAALGPVATNQTSTEQTFQEQASTDLGAGSGLQRLDYGRLQPAQRLAYLQRLGQQQGNQAVMRFIDTRRQVQRDRPTAHQTLPGRQPGEAGPITQAAQSGPTATSTSDAQGSHTAILPGPPPVTLSLEQVRHSANQPLPSNVRLSSALSTPADNHSRRTNPRSTSQTRPETEQNEPARLGGTITFSYTPVNRALSGPVTNSPQIGLGMGPVVNNARAWRTSFLGGRFDLLSEPGMTFNLTFGPPNPLAEQRAWQVQAMANLTVNLLRQSWSLHGHEFLEVALQGGAGVGVDNGGTRNADRLVMGTQTALAATLHAGSIVSFFGSAGFTWVWGREGGLNLVLDPPTFNLMWGVGGAF